MKQVIRVYVEGESVILRAPSGPVLSEFLRDLPHEWDELRGLHIFPVAFAAVIEGLAMSIFGTTGEAELVTVQVDASLYADQREIEIGGRTLAYRRLPSRRPVLGEQVFKVAGGWSGAGIGQNTHRPLLGINDATLQLMIPASIAQQPFPGLTVVPTVDRAAALRSEKHRLEARLQDIYTEESRKALA